jgi:hypothetical protein
MQSRNVFRTQKKKKPVNPGGSQILYRAEEENGEAADRIINEESRMRMCVPGIIVASLPHMRRHAGVSNKIEKAVPGRLLTYQWGGAHSLSSSCFGHSSDSE